MTFFLIIPFFRVILIGNFGFNSVYVFTVQDYSELLAELQAVKANVESATAKQAIQTVHNDINRLLTLLKQQDAQQIGIQGRTLVNNLDVLASELNGNRSLQQLISDVSTKIKQLLAQPFPLARYTSELNNIMRDFKNKLYQILGGC